MTEGSPQDKDLDKEIIAEIMSHYDDHGTDYDGYHDIWESMVRSRREFFHRLSDEEIFQFCEHLINTYAYADHFSSVLIEMMCQKRGESF